MSWLSRLVKTFRSRGLEQELDEELRDHIERRAAELRDKGIQEQEARRRAAVRFGNTTLIREQTRDARLWPALMGWVEAGYPGTWHEWWEEHCIEHEGPDRVGVQPRRGE